MTQHRHSFLKILAPNILWLSFVLSGCAANVGTEPAQAVQKPAQNYGVILMAHGGRSKWNEGVKSAVAPLRADTKIEIAFGMADAYSIQEAVDKLESRGVENIGVVRLFVSGESWFERTEKILGLRAGAPDRDPPDHKAMGHGAGHKAMGHRMEFWQVDSSADFALSKQGLSEASAMDAILVERALGLSTSPEAEDILILAHGPGDDAENQRWITNITARAALVKSSAPFRRVKVMTLREDWHDKRKDAEIAIRAFVKRAGDEGGSAIVIPFRTHGFGPYAKVLEGLDYRSDGKGLIPHENVTLWIKQQSDILKASGF